MIGVTEVEYVCAECGAKDHWKAFPGEIIPPVLNCWNCHAGQGLDIGKQLVTKQGMFPVPSADEMPAERVAQLAD